MGLNIQPPTTPEQTASATEQPTGLAAEPLRLSYLVPVGALLLLLSRSGALIYWYAPPSPDGSVTFVDAVAMGLGFLGLLGVPMLVVGILFNWVRRRTAIAETGDVPGHVRVAAKLRFAALWGLAASVIGRVVALIQAFEAVETFPEEERADALGAAIDLAVDPPSWLFAAGLAVTTVATFVVTHHSRRSRAAMGGEGVSRGND